MSDPLVDAANAISTASPKVRAFALLAASRIIALEQATPPAPMPTPTPAPAPQGSRLGIDKVGQYLTGVLHLAEYELVIVSADGAAAAAALPARRKLIYCNGSAVRSDYSEGPTYAQFSANGWLLPGSAGGRYVVNHTIAAANEAMAQAQLAYCVGHGLTGIFLDDVIPLTPYGIATPAGYRDGVVAYVHRLHDLLHANGLYLLANCNAFADATLGNRDNGAGDLAWAKMLAPDGVMEESAFTTRDGANTLRLSGPAWNQLWDEWVAMAVAVQDAGMDFVALSYRDLYPYASLLLADKGRAAFVYVNGTTAAEPWGAWARILGPPIDPPLTNPRRFRAVDGTTVVTVSVDHVRGVASIV